MTPTLVGIAGPSCSGKTQLARWISHETGAPILRLDNYYRDHLDLTLEERAQLNFDVPEALETELIFEHARSLAAGKPVEAPVYDFSTHTRELATETVAPLGIVILDGIFTLLWPELRELLNLAIYIETPDEVCLARRIDRDVRERGRTRASVLQQYAATVRPMAELHIRPTAQYAHIVVPGTVPVSETGPSVLQRLQGARNA